MPNLLLASLLLSLPLFSAAVESCKPRHIVFSFQADPRDIQDANINLIVSTPEVGIGDIVTSIKSEKLGGEITYTVLQGDDDITSANYFDNSIEYDKPNAKYQLHEADGDVYGYQNSITVGATERSLQVVGAKLSFFDPLETDDIDSINVVSESTFVETINNCRCFNDEMWVQLALEDAYRINIVQTVGVIEVSQVLPGKSNTTNSCFSLPIHRPVYSQLLSVPGSETSFHFKLELSTHNAPNGYHLVIPKQLLISKGEQGLSLRTHLEELLNPAPYPPGLPPEYTAGFRREVGVPEGDFETPKEFLDKLNARHPNHDVSIVWQGLFR